MPPRLLTSDLDAAERKVIDGVRNRSCNCELTFVLAGDHLRTETDAAFPGVLGRLYRAALIGSGGRRGVTRRQLRQVARAR